MKRWGWLAVLAVVAATGARAQAPDPDPDPWFGRDKAVHFAVSASLASLGYVVAWQWQPENEALRLVAAGSAAMAFGVAKELLDLTLRLGTPSWKDLAWDAAGTAVGLAVSWALDRWIVGPLVTLVQLSCVRVAGYAR